MTIVSVSIPSEINQRIVELASRQRRSKSQVVAEAVDQYAIRSSWELLRKTGDQLAKKFAIESDEDVERFFG